MSKSLGVFVSSNQHLDTIIEMCKAAKRKGIEVSIFFTHKGVLLTQDPRFAELEGLARVSLCNVGFESYGLQRPVKGLSDKDYATQARHAAILDECERYISF